MTLKKVKLVIFGLWCLVVRVVTKANACCTSSNREPLGKSYIIYFMFGLEAIFCHGLEHLMCFVFGQKCLAFAMDLHKMEN